MRLKIGSLFDGSGGFPLAGAMCGFVPTWAAEVEPYPIAVTRSRFPNMRHLGDVSKLNGADIEPVDIICGGSPCQDLSVAGKRRGLKHIENGDEETTRSGLFMEMVRIIKEMRNETNGEYPTFVIWENVPGAFSSNNGNDFRLVLEEFIKIAEPQAVMPAVPKGGWAYADCYCGDGWSLAYRVFDAQYWGVPQRRRRIHLVLDLRGERAGKILFEREGLRGYFTEGRTPWQAIAADAQGRAPADDRAGECFDGYNGDLTGAASATLGVNCGVSTGRNGVIERIGGLDALGLTNRGFYSGDKAETLRAESHGAIPMVVAPVPYTLKIRSGCEGGGKGALIQENKSATLATNNDQYLFQPVYAIDQQGGKGGANYAVDVVPTICSDSHGTPHAVSYALPCVLEAAGFKAGQSMAGGIGWQKECATTLAAQCSGTEPTVCITECLPFDTTQVTSPQNGCNPKWGDPCHPLAAQGHPPTVICKCYDARGNGDGQTVSTLTGDHENRVSDYTIICLQGNAIDRSDTAGCNGKGWNDKTAYTLNTIDRHAVAYRQGGFGDYVEGVCGTLKASGGDFGGGSENLIIENTIRYIVRRLTPTECARLQGFPDKWGHPDYKDSFTDKEYRFWLGVRNTHAEINGKAVKDYTLDQMLTWYNKLHTDSAEYKLWGNGIALPPALYCMQGIQDALERMETKKC